MIYRNIVYGSVLEYRFDLDNDSIFCYSLYKDNIKLLGEAYSQAFVDNLLDDGWEKISEFPLYDKLEV